MNAKEKAEAYRKDIERLMGVIKTLDIDSAKKEAAKIWRQIRIREADSDFEATYSEEPFYQHCCKTCKYRILVSKRHGVLPCGVLSSGVIGDTDAGVHCNLVDKWKESRKKGAK